MAAYQGTSIASATKKSTKETFHRLLLICSETYVYGDESKDVKGKTERLRAISELQTLLKE